MLNYQSHSSRVSNLFLLPQKIFLKHVIYQEIVTLFLKKTIEQNSKTFQNVPADALIKGINVIFTVPTTAPLSKRKKKRDLPSAQTALHADLAPKPQGEKGNLLICEIIKYVIF